DLVAQRFLHRLHAIEHVVEAVLGDLALVHGAVIAGLLLPGAVVEVVVAVLLRRVEADALLDHEEAFRLLGHPLDVGGKILGAVAFALPADRPVIDADLVAHLAAKQLVGGDVRGLAGDVPQGVLDHRHGSAIGLEAAALPNLHHAALDVGRVLADQRIAEMQDEGLQVGLGVFDFAEAVDAFVGDDAHDRVLADDGNAQVGNLHDAPFGLKAILLKSKNYRICQRRSVPFRWATPICSMMWRPEPSTWRATTAAAPSASWARMRSISSRCSFSTETRRLSDVGKRRLMARRISRCFHHSSAAWRL